MNIQILKLHGFNLKSNIKYRVKKLLIAGGSYGDIPLIKAAQSLGYYVITTGNRPLEKGHIYSDKFVYADFSDKEAIFSLAKDLKIDAICSSCNDFSIVSAAYTAQKLSLPGFDNYKTTVELHHKDHFKTIATQIGLPRVKSLCIDLTKENIPNLEGLQFPLIVKPVNLTGGKGISKIECNKEIFKALQFASSQSRLKRVVIEEYFVGDLHSYSTFIKDRKVIFEYSDNEFSYLNPYLVSTSTSPTSTQNSVLKNIRLETEKLANALELSDGILHAQFLSNGSQYKIIEYTRRLPGDFYSIPVMISTGFDQAKAVIEQCCDIPIKIPLDYSQSRFVSRHCVMAEKPGTIIGTRISKTISENIIDKFELMAIGEKINNSLIDKQSVIFLEYASLREMEFKNRDINNLIKVITA